MEPETKVDWAVYLERKQSLYMFATFFRCYGSLCLQESGFSYKHQLTSFKKGMGTFYRSSAEMEAGEKYYLGLIRAEDPRVEKWVRDANTYNALADDLILKFTAPVPLEHIRRAFWDTQDETEKAVLHGTVLPYRVMSAVNYAVEKEGAVIDEFAGVMELYEPLRSVTRYPQIAETVWRSFWRAASETTGTGSEEIFSLCSPEEIESYLSGTAKPDIGELLKRDDGCILWPEGPDDRAAFDASLDAPARRGLALSANDKVSELKGAVANKGVARGKARIVNTMEDATGFEDGDIVVSINTSPSLMPVLSRCGGIVTDEGGIMCHAAIVSRELNKPCVIGTKVATKVFKNADMLEVDADRGVVTLLS